MMGNKFIWMFKELTLQEAFNIGINFIKIKFKLKLFYHLFFR